MCLACACIISLLHGCVLCLERERDIGEGKMLASFFCQVRRRMVAHFDIWKSQDFIATDFNFLDVAGFFFFFTYTTSRSEKK